MKNHPIFLVATGLVLLFCGERFGIYITEKTSLTGSRRSSKGPVLTTVVIFLRKRTLCGLGSTLLKPFEGGGGGGFSSQPCDNTAVTDESFLFFLKYLIFNRN